ncbi:MAG: HesA/MoeB/ThiF family protein [Methanocorpusculum sp.]|nr:HesA/MoeB/ThiF family protein [Methanocorpusculum sp.]
MASERYARQLPLIGAAGQEALAGAVVFVAGAGGLGSPVSLYLAEAGVGTLRIADLDVIEESNLNRQILHPEDRIGRPKAASAKQTLEALNPAYRVEAFAEKIDEASVLRLVGGADLIVDCMDNFAARYVLNRAAIALGIPLLHGAVAGYSGQLTLVVPGKTPCLSCIFPHAETTQKTPVLGAVAGVVGSLQALEAVRYLTGEPTLAGKLLIYDGAANTLDTFAVKKSPRCPDCGGGTETL